MTTLSDLQNRIGETNEKNGFHEYKTTPEEYKNHYLSSKLMLVAGELGEAQEELRTGHSATEVYYTLSVPTEMLSGEDSYEDIAKTLIEGGQHGKPEGFGVEIADAVIRLFDLAYEADIDLGALIEEKLQYNATRSFKHGKNF